MSTKDIYPLTIVKDRYSGCYTGGYYTAWNLFPDKIPEEIFSIENAVVIFVRTCNIPFGAGDTPDEAIKDLCYKLSVQ